MNRYAFRQLLLVEDNPGDAFLIVELLDDVVSSGGQIQHVENLQAAVAALRTQTPDVVLLDLRLPDGSGVDCVRALQDSSSDVPIVVLTGLDDEELALLCIQAGAQDYLSKTEIKREPLRRALRYAVTRAEEMRVRRRADELHARLAAIVEASSDAIFSADVAGVITSWNHGAEAIFGYSQGEALGQSAGDVMRPVSMQQPDLAEQAAEQLQRFARLLDAGGVGAAEELVRCTRDGRVVHISATSSVLRDGAGAVVGVSAICRDITEHKRRDAELRQRNDQLMLRDQQLRALLTRLHAVREDERTRISREVHDQLGQLLTGFKMDLRWIRRRAEAQDPAFAGPVLSRLAAAEELVDETIATVQRIAVELRPSALDALGLGAAVRDEARRFEERAGMAVTLQVDVLANPDAGRATALFRILQELLTNVTRHAHATNVAIRLGAYDGGVELRVADDGVGIARDALARASSLGLLGIQERAQSLGGVAEIVASASGGTVATVRLPA